MHTEDSDQDMVATQKLYLVFDSDMETHGIFTDIERAVRAVNENSLAPVIEVHMADQLRAQPVETHALEETEFSIWRDNTKIGERVAAEQTRDVIAADARTQTSELLDCRLQFYGERNAKLTKRHILDYQLPELIHNYRVWPTKYRLCVSGD